MDSNNQERTIYARFEFSTADDVFRTYIGNDIIEHLANDIAIQIDNDIMQTIIEDVGKEDYYYSNEYRKDYMLKLMNEYKFK